MERTNEESLERDIEIKTAVSVEEYSGKHGSLEEYIQNLDSSTQAQSRFTLDPSQAYLLVESESS